MSKTSKVRQAKGGGCMMVGFFGIFAAVGAGAFYFLTWQPIFSILMAREWVEAECVIVSSEVGVSSGSDGSTYRVEIEYTYEADGQTYRGDSYDFSSGSSSGYESKARVVASHPPGSETACYYDPDEPGRSVINRSPGGYLWWGLFPLPFLAVGVGGLVFMLTPAGRRKMKPGGQRQASEPAIPADTRGPLELESRASPTMKVLGTLFFAVFWNGIVSVFVFGQIIPSFRSGDIDGCLTIFMIPFVLIGLFAIFYVFYQLLAWFNPRPHLTLTQSHLTPGQETSLGWRFSGRAGRIRKLTIELEGKEEVRYRRGTSTHTDDHVFFSRELTSVDRLQSVHRGSVQVSIPERTMPTFKADNNKIQWRLKVRGDIPYWPDVIEDFSITVYPG